MTTECDVVVLGLGPGGESVAGELAAAGLEVVGVEKNLVGGECPYYGCIPSKMMVRAADLLAEAGRVRDHAGDATVTPSWEPVARRIDEQATTSWDDTIAVDRLVEAGVSFVRGAGRLTGPRAVEVDGTAYVARRGVVLNTGTDPAVPPVDGLADTPFWTNRDAVKVTELPRTLGVIGGGAIGVEMAQAFARFGVQVTVVEVADRILAPEEPEASELITRVFSHEGVRVMAGASLTAVSYDEGTFTLQLDGEQVRVDKLLVSAGRRPQLAEIGLETVGLDPEARSIDVDDRMRAGEGLWAIGDITGKGAFTHMSMYQAAIAVADVLGKDGPRADYRAVPHVTFTDPEVGSVGMTEQAARDAGVKVRTATTDLSTSARGWIHGAEGLIKLVEDADRGVLVGATAVAPTGGEILGMLATAVHAEVPTATLRSMIYAYPTLHRAVEDTLETLG